jgi:alkanesulfonate monooxygenase SsuD/methylene tetrahydromethanopterin reductase-like flavin-dependent oxidoreductase (luciferase family)
MEFGMIPNWSWPTDGSPRNQTDNTLEQARTAVQNDYDAVWFGQHYISEGNNHFQPLPLMSRVAGFAGDADLGTSIFLLPLHNPVAVAENFATADALFDGDLVFGIALGYKQAEFDAFGIDKTDRTGRFVEAVRLLRKLWTEDNVTYDGRHFSVSDVTVDPKPNDGNGVPIWFGANGEKTVERAGRMGDTWIISARTTYDEADRLADIYREAADRSDRPEAGIAMNREVYVAESTEEAIETVAPMMKERAAQWLDRGAQDTADQIDDLDEQVHEMLEERIVGSPEECIDRIARFDEGVGIDHLIAMYNWRRLSQERTLDSIERFAEDVVPYFRDEYADV